MIKVYGHPASRSFRIYWLLEELQVPYDSDFVSQKTPEYLKINPNNKVPSLQDGSVYLFESGAISYYICAKYKSWTLLPREGSSERGQVDQWMFWVVTELEQPLNWNAKNMKGLPEALRVSNFKPQAEFEFEKCKRILKTHLQNRDYLVGGMFSLADIFCAHTLNWAKGAGFFTNEDAVLEKYISRMKARESFTKAKNLLKKI